MKKANKSRNDTWNVPVDVGFRYLTRLHFSEVGLKIARNDDLVFKVLINEIIAQTNIETVKESIENSIPRYRDYMVMMRGHKREGRRDILISLLSYDELIDGKGLLAGIEVFKLSNPDNNLASPNPLPPQQDSPSWIIQTLLSVLDRTNAMATFAVTMLALVNTIVHKLREIWEAGSSEEKNKPSARAERLCRRFSLAEIRLATTNFSDALFIGRGGFGKVYKGLIDKGKTTVAVKRLKSNSRQGAHEFLTEIETLSELRHVNLASLIGYCNEHGEMILVYDYMAGGTLADHLYKLQRENEHCISLTWKQRLNICIGAARGLDYLHTGHGVIHRDVKASNILLDENLVAKVSDFGLAKHENRSTSQSHISTKVKGTKGYLDAHYMSTGKLTRKSDTYAFGVVLLEVLCGRPAVDLMLPEDEHILTKWARENISEGKVHEILASSLRDEISEGSLKAFVEIAERCLLDEPKKRPTMAQVMLQLEFALEQQESKQLLVLNEISSVSYDIRPCNDEIDLSKNLTPRPKEQANSKAVSAGFPSGRKDGRKAKTYKPSRLWPWDAFWNRVKPPKKKELLLSEIDEEICEANIKLNKFDWNTVAAATNQFSTSQLIGQGRNGPVYKAVLPTGQLVAVKRHSSSSVLSLKEFNAEIFFLPNIMHRNIIKLLGYCIHRKEKIAVLEIVSGRRHQQHKPYQESHVLPNYAWKLWNEGKAVDLVDESCVGAFQVEEALRCIQVGLLCTQEEPNHRPEMYSVLKMLEGEEPVLEPQKPPPRASLLYHEATFLMQRSNSMTHYQDGQVVAVKKRSSSSVQGLKELKNELLWLSKLQHQNIIKLLGYCIHRDEKLLVYEFMENRSLDAYGDEGPRQHLPWPLRFNIIMGVARGLLYLHQDSGLRIIHKHIKTNNILLDAEMNPKISDFDFARTLAEHQTESETACIVGTYGYIPPEYFMHGKYSFKTDVYSFGITVLEIVSGRRNYCYTLTEERMTLLHYAWVPRNEGKAVDLVDESLGGAFAVEEALRCIQVGLLCTQDEPYHRPEMRSVIKMLEGKELILEPHPPASLVHDDAASGCSDATFEYDDTLQR
ncbi:UNVERIFIED_CONTAM: putative receptor-like protein kinase [Sesamum radiatum]|uniref:non-specific serine/threonine protein kinase n=1 Tax=Sesamum radiatum TaxID=300843 RepID=A0AAW2RD72_SESRA